MSPAAAPVPPPDSAGAFYWQGARARKLLILRCQSCGTYIHLPRPVCRTCRSFDLEPEQMSGVGKLYSFTETFKAFHPYFAERVPYMLAAVELVEQPALMVFTNLVVEHRDTVRIGMPLEVAFEDRGPELTVPVFRPLRELQ